MDGLAEYRRVKMIEKGIDPDTGEPLKEQKKKIEMIYVTRDGKKVPMRITA